MDYQNSYEDYMQSVLGYNPMPNNNIYNSTYSLEDDYYYNQNTMTNTYSPMQTQNPTDVNTDLLNSLYPEIYKIVYPMVCKACNQVSGREITKELIDSLNDEIYRNIEDDELQETPQNRVAPLKNGDVRNPNAKEQEMTKQTRQSNFLLRDLIRILILRELIRQNRPGRRPGTRPPMPPRPPMRPRTNYAKTRELLLLNHIYPITETKQLLDF